MKFKDYGNNALHNLKRFNIINISREDFYIMYNKYTSSKLNDNNLFSLEAYNSLFVNFVIKNNKCEGKIFEQKEDIKHREFNEQEINLLIK